jgi:hypothetical protein
MDRDAEASSIIRLAIGDNLPLDGKNDKAFGITRAKAQQLAERIFNDLDARRYLITTLPSDRRIAITKAITDAIRYGASAPGVYPRDDWVEALQWDWTGVVDAIHENLVHHRCLTTGAGYDIFAKDRVRRR